MSSLETRDVLEAKMFSSIGIPEIVAGVILGIATVWFWLFWRGGGQNLVEPDQGKEDDVFQRNEKISARHLFDTVEEKPDRLN